VPSPFTGSPQPSRMFSTLPPFPADGNAQNKLPLKENSFPGGTNFGFGQPGEPPMFREGESSERAEAPSAALNPFDSYDPNFSQRGSPSGANGKSEKAPSEANQKLVESMLNDLLKEWQSAQSKMRSPGLSASEETLQNQNQKQNSLRDETGQIRGENPFAGPQTPEERRPPAEQQQPEKRSGFPVNEKPVEDPLGTRWTGNTPGNTGAEGLPNNNSPHYEYNYENYYNYHYGKQERKQEPKPASINPEAIPAGFP